MTARVSAWTAEEIKIKILSDYTWLTKGIVALYQRQTREEQIMGETREHNRMGFNALDAEFLSSLAVQILAGRRLSDRQVYYAQKKMTKYCGQLARIANEHGGQAELEQEAQDNTVCTICSGPVDIEGYCLEVTCRNYSADGPGQLPESQAEIVQSEPGVYTVTAESLGLDNPIAYNDEPEEIIINGKDCGLAERITDVYGSLRTLVYRSIDHKIIRVQF